MKTKEETRLKDDVCECGHTREFHGKSHSINYTQGRCEKCDCKNYLQHHTFNAVDPTIQHTMECARLSGEPCNCGADYKPAFRPICPECGCNTIVVYTPPKEPIEYSKIGTPEYIDWHRANLYCCNGETNCKVEFKFMDYSLSTPLNGKKVKYF